MLKRKKHTHLLLFLTLLKRVEESMDMKMKETMMRASTIFVTPHTSLLKVPFPRVIAM